MELLLKHNTTKKEVYLNVTDLRDSKLFYHFDDVVLPEGMDDGEYTFSLYRDSELLCTGICQIGDYKPEKTTYNKTSEIIQYNG